MARSPRVNVNHHVGQKLRARRVELGLSQEAVGKAIGIASQQVQKYEKGVNAMNAKRFYDFALFLKVAPAYFFEGLPDPSRKSAASNAGLAQGVTAAGGKNASDRESLEVLKSFKAIRDYAVRKRLADLLRSLSLKDI